MNTRGAYRITSLMLALMLGLLASGLAVPQTLQSNRIITHYDGSEEDFPNPERGFHKNTDLMTTRDLHWAREQGYSLVRAYVQLDEFRNRPLSAAFLQKLNTGFGVARIAGVKVLPVFAYNFPYRRRHQGGAFERHTGCAARHSFAAPASIETVAEGKSGRDCRPRTGLCGRVGRVAQFAKRAGQPGKQTDYPESYSRRRAALAHDAIALSR